jgi:hypothetical protein
MMRSLGATATATQRRRKNCAKLLCSICLEIESDAGAQWREVAPRCLQGVTDRGQDYIGITTGAPRIPSGERNAVRLTRHTGGRTYSSVIGWTHASARKVRFDDRAPYYGQTRRAAWPNSWPQGLWAR